MIYKKYCKSPLEFIISMIMMILFLPVCIFIIMFLAISLHGNPIYLQKRVGLNSKIFTLIKFRTMTNMTDSENRLAPDSERLTKIGTFVRQFSLDELPQLINVLKGDMSLVGPRPLLIEYLPLYTEDQSHRHDVKPGITGWAQVNGRNAISWEEKFNLDLWYISHQSLILDLKIIMLTIKKIFIHEGVNANANVTMERFKGVK